MTASVASKAPSRNLRRAPSPVSKRTRPFTPCSLASRRAARTKTRLGSTPTTAPRVDDPREIPADDAGPAAHLEHSPPRFDPDEFQEAAAQPGLAFRLPPGLEAFNIPIGIGLAVDIMIGVHAQGIHVVRWEESADWDRLTASS